jgi:hypothetical protein
MHLGRPFRNVTGILAGTPVHVSPADVERIWSHFEAERGERRADSVVTDGERRRGSERRRSP